MRSPAAAIVLLFAASSAQAQVAVDISQVQMVPGTQTLISPNDTFTMNGESFVIPLPQCPSGQHWIEWIADPEQPAYQPSLVITGTPPARARFSWRDPGTGNSLGTQTTALVCSAGP